MASSSLLVAAVVPLAASGLVSAGTITVTTTVDGGPGSLRDAVDQANANPGEDTIVLADGATYVLDDCKAGVDGALQVTEGPLTIRGNGATIQQTCDGAAVLVNDSADLLALVDVTLTGGEGDFGGDLSSSGGPLDLTSTTLTNGSATFGGGVASEGGAVHIADSTITGNKALTQTGGGVAVFGADLAIDSSTISDNEAGAGAGVMAAPPLVLPTSIDSVRAHGFGAAAIGLAADEVGPAVTITDSTIANNTASGYAGGVAVFGTLTLDRSLINGNAAKVEVGGVYMAGWMTMRNSTVSENSAGGAVGGVGVLAVERLAGPQGAEIDFATIAGNAAPETANLGAGAVSISTWGSVVSDPSGGVDCGTYDGGSIATTGYNWSDDTSCGFTAGTDQQVAGGDAMLAALADNGGPTETHLPVPGSPLKNAIPVGTDGCSGTDQRGIDRPQGPGCDIGAVEVVQPTAADGDYTTPNTSTLTIDLKTLVTDPDGVFSTVGSHYTLSDGPTHGIADPHDQGVVDYIPQGNYAGPDSFDYTVCDSANQVCVDATILITVTGQVVTAAVPTFTG